VLKSCTTLGDEVYEEARGGNKRSYSQMSAPSGGQAETRPVRGRNRLYECEIKYAEYGTLKGMGFTVHPAQLPKAAIPTSGIDHMPELKGRVKLVHDPATMPTDERRPDGKPSRRPVSLTMDAFDLTVDEDNPSHEEIEKPVIDISEPAERAEVVDDDDLDY
jgi:hypothetical protein